MASTVVADETAPTRMKREPPQQEVKRSKVVFLMGKGGVGKSTLACVAIEAAREAGRQVRIFDIDPANLRGSPLAARFDGVEVPPSLGYDDRREWLEGKMLEIGELTATGKPQTVLVDAGADDPLLLDLGGEVEFVDMLESDGIDVVGIHVIGDAEGDLRYLRETEEAGLFRPRRIAVVLNAGRVPSDQSPKAAFAPQVRRVIEMFRADPLRSGEGPVFASFPKLACMSKVQDPDQNAKPHGPDEPVRLRTFRETTQHPDRAWSFDRKRVAHWFDKKIPDQILAPLKDFLP